MLGIILGVIFAPVVAVAAIQMALDMNKRGSRRKRYRGGRGRRRR